MVALNKKVRYFLLIVMSGILVVASIWGAIWVTHTESAQLGNAEARCTSKNQVVHQVSIKNNMVMPIHTDAQICDRLIITNDDAQDRLLAFGAHEAHQAYDGVSERLLSSHQSLTVTLVQPGDFTFHDHAQDSVTGGFHVSGIIKRQ